MATELAPWRSSVRTKPGIAEHAIAPVYSSPVRYRELQSGFMSKENQDLAYRSASVVVDQQGRGRVVLLSDNPVFRAHWLGTERLLATAVFFGSLIAEPN